MHERSGYGPRTASPWVFLDEMGYARWPDPACDWTGRAPDARRWLIVPRARDRLWRIIAAMNALKPVGSTSWTITSSVVRR